MQDLFYLTIPLYCSSLISVSIFLHIPMSFLPVFSPSALSNTRQQKCLSLNESACKWREWSVTSDAGCGRRHLFSYSQHWDSQCPKPAETWGVCIRCGCRSSEGAGKVNKTNSKVCAILKKNFILKNSKIIFLHSANGFGETLLAREGDPGDRMRSWWAHAWNFLHPKLSNKTHCCCRSHQVLLLHCKLSIYKIGYSIL